MRQGRFPAKDKLVVGFAHAAYQGAAELASRNTGMQHFQVSNLDDLKKRAGEFDVLVCSMMWRNELLDLAPRLRLVQSMSVGIDQYDQAAFRSHGVRLANARGVNERAVAEHTMALMLSMTRMISSGRDNQQAKVWRNMIAQVAAREDELGGKTLLVVGLGTIGQRVATLAKAFDMHVIGTRRDPSKGGGAADEIHSDAKLLELIPRADVVAVCCPLTPDTRGLMNAAAFAAMKPSALFINVARGAVVDEAALIATMQAEKIRGAALDCVMEEPLPATSPLWTLPRTIITPHTGGETQLYEKRVVDVLLDNLDRLWKGEVKLRNEIV